MAAELNLTCPGCGHKSVVPFAALRRDNSYCGKCGKRHEFAGVPMPVQNAVDTTMQRKKPKKSSRQGQRR